MTKDVTNKRFTFEFVKYFFEKEKYQLLSTEYKNKETKLETICPNGHRWSVRFGDFKNQNSKCSTCSGQKPYTYEEVKEYFNKYGYKLLSGSYKNKETKINTICPNNHSWSVTFGKFKNGKRRCIKCSNQEPYTYEEVKDIFTKEKYELLSDSYKSNKDKLTVKCSKGHIKEMTFKHFQNRSQRCSTCNNNGESKLEQELFNILKEYHHKIKKLRHTKIKYENRPYLTKFEIDIYDPVTNRGIEFDGKHWHNTKILAKSHPTWPKDDIPFYHQIKDEYFLSKSIEILHIKEEDWIKDKQMCIDRCLNFLKKEDKQ